MYPKIAVESGANIDRVPMHTDDALGLRPMVLTYVGSVLITYIQIS